MQARSDQRIELLARDRRRRYGGSYWPVPYFFTSRDSRKADGAGSVRTVALCFLLIANGPIRNESFEWVCFGIRSHQSASRAPEISRDNHAMPRTRSSEKLIAATSALRCFRVDHRPGGNSPRPRDPIVKRGAETWLTGGPTAPASAARLNNLFVREYDRAGSGPAARCAGSVRSRAPRRSPPSVCCDETCRDGCSRLEPPSHCYVELPTVFFRP